MEGLTQLCADGSRHGVTNTKKSSKDKSKKRRRSDEDDGTPRPSDTPRPSPASRSSRSSPIMPFEDGKPPPKKQRKTEPTGPVPVLKVHPSEFPVELLVLNDAATDADPSVPGDLTKIFTPGGAFDAEDSSSPGFPVVAKTSSEYQDIICVQIEKHFLMNCARCHEEGSDDYICCSKCPRSYHTKCFEQSSSAATQECKRCGSDKEILPEDEIVKSVSVDENIESAHSHLAESSNNFTLCGILLSQIKQIIEKLKVYDYGWVFAEPGKGNHQRWRLSV